MSIKASFQSEFSKFGIQKKRRRKSFRRKKKLKKWKKIDREMLQKIRTKARQ
jgi:hypothetical protein